MSLQSFKPYYHTDHEITDDQAQKVFERMERHEFENFEDAFILAPNHIMRRAKTMRDLMINGDKDLKYLGRYRLNWFLQNEERWKMEFEEGECGALWPQFYLRVSSEKAYLAFKLYFSHFRDDV